jgi:hypothetical protein
MLGIHGRLICPTSRIQEVVVKCFGTSRNVKSRSTVFAKPVVTTRDHVGWGLREKGLEPEGLLQSREELEKFMKSERFLNLDLFMNVVGFVKE